MSTGDDFKLRFGTFSDILAYLLQENPKPFFPYKLQRFMCIILLSVILACHLPEETYHPSPFRPSDRKIFPDIPFKFDRFLKGNSQN